MKFLVLFAFVASAAAASLPMDDFSNGFSGSNFDLNAFIAMLQEMDPESLQQLLSSPVAVPSMGKSAFEGFDWAAFMEMLRKDPMSIFNLPVPAGKSAFEGFDWAAFMEMLRENPMSIFNLPVPAGKAAMNAKASPTEFRQILSQYPELAQLLSVYEQLNLSDAERQEVLDMLPSLGYPAAAKYYDPMTGNYYPDQPYYGNPYGGNNFTYPAYPGQFQIFQYFGDLLQQREPTTTPYYYPPGGKYYDPMTGNYYPDQPNYGNNNFNRTGYPGQFQIFQYFGDLLQQQEPTTTSYYYPPGK